MAFILFGEIRITNYVKIIILLFEKKVNKGIIIEILIDLFDRLIWLDVRTLKINLIIRSHH